MIGDTGQRISGLERLLKALGSNNLQLHVSRVSDADLLIASGLTAAHLGPLATTLVRLLGTPSASDFERAQASVEPLVRSLSRHRGWRLNGRAIEEVASLSAQLYAKPNCSHCGGRGRVVPDGGDAAVAPICTHCRGTGRRQGPKQHREYTDATLDQMLEMERMVVSSMRRVM